MWPNFLRRKEDLEGSGQPEFKPSTPVIKNHPTSPSSPYEVLLADREMSEDDSNDEE